MRALLSVYDKYGVVDLARGLVELGWRLLATGNTSATLSAADVPHDRVEDVTGVPELLGGRVKTLHPAIHAGILARRDVTDHVRDLQQSSIEPIDMVVANLYPFARTVRTAPDEQEILEQIDVGGVTLLRAAAKNFRDVTVVSHPTQYGEVLEELRRDGATALATRRRLAARAFEMTATYDAQIATTFRAWSREAFPPHLVVPLRKVEDLRYGENPHQRAALYAQDALEPATSGRADLAGAEQIRGEALSFTNLLDADAALSIVEEYRAPTVVLIKHTNPCGIASHAELAEAFRRAHASDPVAAYGCIMATNRTIDAATAQEMRRRVMDIVLAPDYDDEALAILNRKRESFRILRLPIGRGIARAAPTADEEWIPAHELDIQRIHGGALVQTPDAIVDDDVQLTPVSARHPTLEELTDLRFAWKALRHVKSNSVILAKNMATVGIGAGQQSRVIAVEIAAKQAGDRARGAVLATDGFFPFPDGVEAGARAGVTAMVHPGGGIREQEIIDAANAHGVAMVTTGGLRYFKH